MRHTALLITSLILLAGTAVAQEGAVADPFSEEQLEQIAAPVALYPDSLLMQIFMASTYPLEVVEAQRWLEGKKLSGKDLEAALKDREWDASVKSLCSFPDVLNRMSENLDWTRDMGDAFLGQQAQLLDAVQRLRNKAYDAGQLKSSAEQVVTVQEDKIIVIEPAQPEVVYVPSYSPTVVYGTWPYPTTYYAPLYAPPPPGYGALAFTAGMIVGGALWGDCDWDWGDSDCNIDIDNHNNFNRNTNNNFQQINNKKWEHKAEHRKGVNYRDGATAKRFGGSGAGSRVSRGEARGFEQRGQAGDGRGAGAARPAPGRGAAAGSREARRSPSAAPRPAPGPGAGPSSRQGRGGAMGGSRSPSGDRAASSRGASSRGSVSRGGSSRSGRAPSGGRGGGGGGGRGGGGRR
jgi:hypothetical protein